MGLLTQASVAIDGSKFKAVNNRDKNFTRAKMDRRMAQIEESVGRYLQQLDTADRQEPFEALKTKTSRLKEKIAKLKGRCSAFMHSRRGCSPRRISSIGVHHGGLALSATVAVFRTATSHSRGDHLAALGRLAPESWS
jgi:hypothetical protein